MKILVLVALLISTAARAQLPSFDTQTNILRLPALQVGPETVYTDVQLAMPQGRAWSLFSVGAARSSRTAASNTYPMTSTIQNFGGSLLADSIFTLANGQLWTGCTAAPTATNLVSPANPDIAIYQTGANNYRMVFVGDPTTCSPYPFVQYSAGAGAATSSVDFTVQPTELTGTTTQQQLVFVVVGGLPPYQAISTNPDIFTVANINHSTSLARASGILQLTGAAGTSSVVITDSAGGILLIPASITAQTVTPVVAPPLVASPTVISGSYGNAITLLVSGGTPPYIVEPSNQAVIIKLSQENDSATANATVELYITGTAGNAFIGISDAAGNQVSIPVSVQ